MAQHDASDAHSLFAAIAGPWLAGTILGTGLTGCIIVQIYDYHIQYRDPWPLRFLATVLVFIVVADTTSAFERIYTHFIQLQSPLDTIATVKDNRAIVAAYACQIIIAALAQAFYTTRVWRLTRGRIGTFLLFVFIFTTFTTGLTRLVLAAKEGADPVVGNYRPVSIVYKVLSAVTDLLISLVLVGHLHLEKGVAGSARRTNSVIQRLVNLALETAVPTAVIATMTAVFAGVHGPASYWSLFWDIILGRVYVLGVLHCLNVRFAVQQALSRDLARGVSHSTMTDSKTMAELGKPSDHHGSSHSTTKVRFKTAAHALGHRREDSGSSESIHTVQGIHVELETVAQIDDEFKARSSVQDLPELQPAITRFDDPAAPPSPPASPRTTTAPAAPPPVFDPAKTSVEVPLTRQNSHHTINSTTTTASTTTTSNTVITHARPGIRRPSAVSATARGPRSLTSPAAFILDFGPEEDDDGLEEKDGDKQSIATDRE